MVDKVSGSGKSEWQGLFMAGMCSQGNGNGNSNNCGPIGRFIRRICGIQDDNSNTFQTLLQNYATVKGFESLFGGGSEKGDDSETGMDTVTKSSKGSSNASQTVNVSGSGGGGGASQTASMGGLGGITTLVQQIQNVF